MKSHGRLIFSNIIENFKTLVGFYKNCMKRHIHIKILKTAQFNAEYENIWVFYFIISFEL